MSDFIQYNGSTEHDLLMFQWWTKMHQDGEFEQTFVKDVDSPSAFMAYFHLPRLLAFKLTTNGIAPKPWICVWIEPCMDGAFLGLWIDREWRNTKKCVRSTEEALEISLKQFPIIIGLTKQKRLLKPHQKMGYTIAGFVPKLWNGDDVWILTLDSWGFKNRKMSVQRREKQWAAAEKAEVRA